MFLLIKCGEIEPWKQDALNEWIPDNDGAPASPGSKKLW